MSYYPWWQVLPQNGTENSISKSVHPGDWILATLAPAPGQSPPAPNQKSAWEMTLTNITQGWTFSTKQSYNGPLNSADWILENPQWCGPGGCNNQTLVNYGQVVFDYGDSVATSLGKANAPNWVSPALTPTKSGPSTKTTGSTPSRDQPAATVTVSSFHTARMANRRGAKTTHRGRSSTQHYWGLRKRVPPTSRCFRHPTRGPAHSRKTGPGRSPAAAICRRA